MSDYFDIYCRTCSVQGNIFQWNHGGEEISRICRDLPVLEKIGMRYQGLADYYGVEGLKQYLAEREWWTSPLLA